MNKGFEGSLDKTHKVVSTVKEGMSNGVLMENGGKTMIGMKSGSKAAINPTSDSDDGNPRAAGMSEGYGMSNKGGASGDGATPGYSGSGSGIAELDGAQNNMKKDVD